MGLPLGISKKNLFDQVYNQYNIYTTLEEKKKSLRRNVKHIRKYGLLRFSATLPFLPRPSLWFGLSVFPQRNLEALSLLRNVFVSNACIYYGSRSRSNAYMSNPLKVH